MFEYVWRKPELVLSLRGWSTEMGTDEHGREEHQHGDVLSPWWQTGHKHHKTKRSADQRCCFASQLDGLLKLARSYRLLADWTERARCGTTSRREEDHSPVGEGNGLIQTWGDFEGFHEVPATNDQRWGLCQTLWAVRAKPSKKYWDTWRKPKPNLQSESSVFEHVFFKAQMCPGEFMYVWSDGQMDLSENCGYPKLWHNVNQNILIDYAK